MQNTVTRYGKLARECLNRRLPLQVLASAKGFYLGTVDEEGPISRESLEYWPEQQHAQAALEQGTWTQREEP